MTQKLNLFSTEVLRVDRRLWTLNGKGIKDVVVVKVFPDGKLNEQDSILNLVNSYQTSMEMQVIKSLRLILSNCFDFQSLVFIS